VALVKPLSIVTAATKNVRKPRVALADKVLVLVTTVLAIAMHAPRILAVLAMRKTVLASRRSKF